MGSGNGKMNHEMIHEIWLLKFEMCDEQNQQDVDKKWEIRLFLFTKQNFEAGALIIQCKISY